MQHTYLYELFKDFTAPAVTAFGIAVTGTVAILGLRSFGKLPTGPMKSEAATAGFVFKSAHGRLPRLQVVTIADILEGRMPKLPPLPQPERIERTAARKQFKDQFELLLPFAGDKVVPMKGDFVDPSIMAIG